MTTKFTNAVRQRFAFLENDHGLIRAESSTNASELVMYSNNEMALKFRFDYRDLRFYFVREHETRTGVNRLALSELLLRCTEVDSNRLQPSGSMQDSIASIDVDDVLWYWAVLLRPCVRQVIEVGQL